MNPLRHADHRQRGLTLMEILLTIALLAIFGVFVMEFLTTSYLATEKDFSRIKCIGAAENILEMAGGLGISDEVSLDDEASLILTFRKIFSNSFDSPPMINVATWTLLPLDSPAHPDGVGSFLAQIATGPNQVSSFTLYVADANLANRIEVKTAFTRQVVEIDYGLQP